MMEMYSNRLRGVLTKDLLIDLEDRSKAEALKAFEMVRDRSGLTRKRARELEGHARFRMMEQGFEDVCGLHGGKLLDGSVIPSTELKVFQPFMRFEVEKQGVILGLAAMPEPRVLPGKNKSRVAGISLNYYLSPRFAFDDAGPKVGDIFSLLLVARNREKGGLIDEIAVGVIDSGYSTFLFYETLDRFLGGRAEPIAPTPPSDGPPGGPGHGGVTLKNNVIPFVPPETPKPEKKDEESS
ncbi:MAG: hypothetical protein ACLP1Y_15270 [Candidatus Acidiferrales bacterium]